MPRSGRPATLRTYAFLPFLSVTVSFALLPGFRSGVFLPAILKSCGILPLFVTEKVTEPAGTDALESLNLNSLAVTVTAVACACDRAAIAGTAAMQSTIRDAAMVATRVLRRIL